MIQSARLRLRAHRVEDFEQYRRLWTSSEPGEPTGPFLLSEEDAWARLLRFVGHWSHFGYGFFVVEDRASGQLVAEAGFAQFRRGVDVRMNDVPEAGWIVLAERRGEGIASEAMTTATEWMDTTFAPARTVSIIHPDNAASIKVASRLGYREFGRGTYKGRPMMLLERTDAALRDT